jgi:phosphonate metabolism protein PhnN/1,5-bisphosphokinase (PRPP-forming)
MITSPLFPKNELQGALVLVVGPSGSGKDTLIGLARNALADDPNFIFPRRVITRTALADAEDHDTMELEAFFNAEAEGRFALSWGAHGLRYGILGDSLAPVREGATAIINVSRGAIPHAEKLGCRVTVLSIVCDPALLAERIAKRGRETVDEIAARLKREAPIAVTTATFVEIRNETRPEDVANAVVDAIRAA